MTQSQLDNTVDAIKKAFDDTRTRLANFASHRTLEIEGLKTARNDIGVKLDSLHRRVARLTQVHRLGQYRILLLSFLHLHLPYLFLLYTLHNDMSRSERTIVARLRVEEEEVVRWKNNARTRKAAISDLQQQHNDALLECKNLQQELHLSRLRAQELENAAQRREADFAREKESIVQETSAQWSQVSRHRSLSLQLQ